MPYVYTQDKNGRFRASGSLSEAEVTPVAGGAGFGKPKPKRKPKPAEKPWWWHVTPQGISNNLRYEQKRLGAFNRRPEPRRTGAMGAVQGMTRAIQRTTPLGRLYQDVLPAAGRQMVMGATVRAAEDAGLAAVNFAQRSLGNAETALTRAGVRNPVARTLLKPAFAPALIPMGLFGPARDPEATPAGRAIVAAGRAARMANRARVREEMNPEDDLIEAIPAGFAANVALAPLTAGIGGAAIKGTGMAAKAGRWGVDLAANEAAANLVTDNTMGGPSSLLKAVGVPVPDALSADPTRDDRISASFRETPNSALISGPLGLVLGAGAGALGRAFEQAPHVARSIRENRMVQELRNARQKTVGNGLQEVDPATGEHTFTPAAKTEPPPPPPPPPPAPPVAGPAPIPSRPNAGFEDFGGAQPGPLPEARNPGADPWMDDAQYQDWLRRNASREIVPVQQGDAVPTAPPVQRQPVAPQDELRGEGLADPWGMGPDPNSPVQQALGQKPGAAYTGSPIEEPAAAPTVKESLTAEEEFYDPELPEIDQAAVALERLEPDVIEQILQTPGPVLPQIEEALASKQPVAPRPELSAVDVTAPSDKLAGSQFLSRQEEWGNLRDNELLGVFHPDVNPGLFEVIRARTGRSFEELTRGDAVETLTFLADQGATVMPDRLKAGIELARTADLVADPERFQYKLNTDRRGVQKGNSLEGLERWNTSMEGSLLVWEDPANGKLYVVNGHNRLAKALELGIPTVPVKRLLASTAEQARALGALDNIASGGGTPWDAARFFRDAGILDAGQAGSAGLPLSSGHAQRGLQLAQLPDNIFQAGLTGDLPEARALALGGSGLSPEKMQAVWSEYQGDKFFRSEDNFQQLIDLARGAPTTATDSGGRLKQGEIPGLETAAERDLTKTLIKLSKAVESNLRSDKRALTGASRNADTLEAKGNSQIDAETAMQAGLDTEQLLRVFDALRYMGGNEINALLKAGAEEVAAGAKVEAVARRIQGELAQAADKVMLPKPPEPVVPEPVAPEAPEAPMPRGEADIEAAKLTILNRAAAGGEVRPSATPIPEPPQVKPGIDLQDVATSADQLKLAQQQRQAALDAGDQSAVAAWDKEIRRINQGRLAADQATRDTSQTGLFGETEYDTTLPLLDPRLQAEEARLEAEYRERDAAVQADMARAEREAAGYQDMTFEEKKTEFGITEGWKPPEAAPPERSAAERSDDLAALTERWLSGKKQSVDYRYQALVDKHFGDNTYLVQRMLDDANSLGSRPERIQVGNVGLGEDPVYAVWADGNSPDARGATVIAKGLKSEDAAYRAAAAYREKQIKKIADLIRQAQAAEDAAATPRPAAPAETPEAAPPAPKPLPPLNSKAGKDLAKKLAQLEEQLANARDVRLPAALDRRDRLAANGMPSGSAEDLVEQLQRQIPNLEKQISDLRAEYGMAAADAPTAVPAQRFTFPEDLAKSAPRYGQATLTFASDYDRAAYILRDASKKSKGEDQLIKALEGQDIDVAEVRAHGKRVHAAIKALSKEQTGSTRAPLKAVDLKVPEVDRVAGGDQGIVSSLSPRTSEAPEGWMSVDTGNASAEEQSRRRAFLTKIIQDVAGDDVIIRFNEVYPLVPRGPEWGGKPGEMATQLGFYRPAPPPDFVGDLIQVNGIAAAGDLVPLTETAYHEAFHRIQWVALGENEARVLDSAWARLKIAIGSGHLLDSAKIAYGESMPVAVQRYATARKAGSDPVQYMLGRAYQKADNRLWDLALKFFSGVDSVLDFAEKVYNSAAGNGFISTRSIFEDFYQGNLIAKYDYSAAPLKTVDKDGWFQQTWNRKAIEKFDKYTALSSTLREADGGKLKGVSKRALQLAEEGSPDQALREATDYAQRRLADIDSEIEAIKQRAIKEGC